MKDHTIRRNGARGLRVRRAALILSVPVLALSFAGGTAVLTAGAAGAAACSATVPAATCTINGSATLTGGSLGVEMSSGGTMAWAVTLTGGASSTVQTGAADPTAIDPTGTNAGWNLTMSATTFTDNTDASAPCSAGSPCTLPNANVLTFTGSTSSVSATTAPTTACVTVGQCTVPTTSGLTWPINITSAAAAPTPVKFFNAAASTGEGATALSNDGWWLNVPGTATASPAATAYTSTMTLAINSGP